MINSQVEEQTILFGIFHERISKRVERDLNSKYNFLFVSRLLLDKRILEKTVVFSMVSKVNDDLFDVVD